MDCRPISKGEAIKKVITKALYKPYMNKIKAGCEPSQFSVGTNGGGSKFIMAITLLLEAYPDWVIIALDVSNAFNDEVFVTEWQKTKGERIRSKMLEIGNLLDPTRIASRHIPSRQCLWLLILNCLQFKGNYFVRNIPPQFTEGFWTTHDSAIDKLMG